MISAIYFTTNNKIYSYLFIYNSYLFALNAIGFLKMIFLVFRYFLQSAIDNSIAYAVTNCNSLERSRKTLCAICQEIYFS